MGATNPGTYLAHVSETLSNSYHWDGWREHVLSRERELIPKFLTFVGFYSTLAAGLMLWMVHRFDRATGRC